MGSKYLSAIDIGSNAVRFGLARVVDDHFEWVQKYRVPIRLGAEVFSKKNEISKNTIDYATAAFSEFASIMVDYKVDDYFCGATSAFREASNKDDFKKQIKKHTGIEIQKIPGELEAEISLLGLQDFIKDFKMIDAKNHQDFILADLGGGSLELNIIKDSSPVARESFPIGTVRLLNIYKDEGRLSPKVQKLINDNFNAINKFLDPFMSGTKSFSVIGTGGNFRRLIKLNQRIFNVDETYVPRRNVSKILKLIQEVDYIHRIKKYGLKPDRADVIVPALDIIDRLVTDHQISKIYAPPIGLIDGMMTHLIKN